MGIVKKVAKSNSYILSSLYHFSVNSHMATRVILLKLVFIIVLLIKIILWLYNKLRKRINMLVWFIIPED